MLSLWLEIPEVALKMKWSVNTTLKFISSKFQFNNRKLSLINKWELNNSQYISESKALEGICYFCYILVGKLIVEIEMPYFFNHLSL